MRHEDATAAIRTVRAWFSGLSTGKHVDGQVAKLIAAILEAEQLADWLHDNGDWRGNDSQEESVALLWAVVKACDVEAIRRAIFAAEKYADDIRSAKERDWHSG